MQINNILSAYIAHTGEVVAISLDSYYVLQKEVDAKQGEVIVNKIKERRMIDDTYWRQVK